MSEQLDLQDPAQRASHVHLDLSSRSDDIIGLDMRRFPGHLRAEAPIRIEALHLLASHYDRYQPFVDDCARLKASVPVSLLDRPTGTNIDAYIATRGIVEAFAKRWKLDCIPEMRESAYYRVRAAVDQVGRDYGVMIGTPFRPSSFATASWEPEDPSVACDGRRWIWRLGSFETLAECRDRIADDLDLVAASIPSAIIQQLWALPDEAIRLGWALTDLPHKLPVHVRWLFLRLCPQPDRPLGPAEIAVRETDFMDAHTTRRAVNELSRMMGITLPPLKVGRPRRTRSAV